MGADVRLVVEPIAAWPPATIDLPQHDRRGDVVGFALIVSRDAQVVKLDGVTYRLGNHATVEQADAAVRRFRAERMPFSPDAMASAS